MAKHNDSPSLFPEEPAVKPQGPVECLGMTFENDEKRREYFLEKLREKLKDPEFRKIEGFPIGEDEDILALSDPPYYTACPNPFLAEFVERHGSTYDLNEPYHREPFAADVTEGKTDPAYLAHSYHTKVPPKAIARYILWFTNPGDVILDSYAGSGMTALAAGVCGSPPKAFKSKLDAEWAAMQDGHHIPWGPRHVILNDLSPAATFISSNYTSGQLREDVERELTAALNEVQASLGWTYQTDHRGWPASERDPRKWINSRESKGIGNVVLVIWTEVLRCVECGAEVNLWLHALDPKNASILDPIPCPECGAVASKLQLERCLETTYDPVLQDKVKKNKFVPAFLIYEWDGRRYEKLADPNDLETLRRLSELPIPVGCPIRRMMDQDGHWGNMFRAGYHQGVTHVHHFFTQRNWVLFGELWSRVASSGGRFVLTSLLNRLSRMSSLHIKNFFRGGGGFAAGNTKGNLYFPSFFIEQSPFEYLPERTKRAGVAFTTLDRERFGSVAISTGSASSLSLPDESIDYAFIDPPFGQNLIYSELSFLWEAWLGAATNVEAESIIDGFRNKDLTFYQEAMKAGFQELYRVLKPSHWVTVEFHNSQNSVWMAIQEAMQAAGFVIADVRVLDKKQGSHKQNVAARAVKKDLVISTYKPNDGLEERFKLEAGTEEGVWDFIRTHLTKLPVFVSKDGEAEVTAERQNYLLFDRMVAFHVQRGVTVPLSAAEFYAGLEQRFPPRDGMYFLPDQAAEYDKKRMTVKEVLQLQLFVSDEASAIQWLKQQLTKKTQTFQDIHPQFLREIGGWQKHEKTLELSELLEQNFLRYDGKGEVPSQIHSYLSSNFKELRNLAKDGLALKAKAKDRWYVPDPNKAGDLEKLRERALMREFEEYRESKQKRLKVFRLEAVRAGFKKAWQERDYATIIAVARKIPDKILQEDPKLLMWYDQAITRTGDES